MSLAAGSGSGRISKVDLFVTEIVFTSETQNIEYFVRFMLSGRSFLAHPILHGEVPVALSIHICPVLEAFLIHKRAGLGPLRCRMPDQILQVALEM